MQTELREVVRLVLDGLPQAALLASRDGEVLLRNAEAQALLPAGADVATVLTASGVVGLHWEADVAGLAESGGRLVRRNVRLTGKGSRQLVADVYVREICLPAGLWGARAERPVASRHLAGRFDGDAVADAAPPGETASATQTDCDCVLVLVQDVSARVSMERRLAAGERLAAAGSIAAKVAHELNNPLDGVLRLVGLAERGAGAEAAGYLQSARDGLTRMATIIRGLLEQGRPWRASGERVAVQRLLDEAVRSMQPRAHALGVAVVSDLDDEVVGTVEGAVFQVFCNVVKNALDAMPNGGLLTIRLRPTPQGCRVAFVDTGCGLTDAEAEQALDPFYSTKPPAEGSGLGLAICREITARLGGTISVAPRPEGGAAVTIHLPLHPPWQSIQEDL